MNVMPIVKKTRGYEMRIMRAQDTDPTQRDGDSILDHIKAPCRCAAPLIETWRTIIAEDYVPDSDVTVWLPSGRHDDDGRMEYVPVFSAYPPGYDHDDPIVVCANCGASSEDNAATYISKAFHFARCDDTPAELLSLLTVAVELAKAPAVDPDVKYIIKRLLSTAASLLNLLEE